MDPNDLDATGCVRLVEAFWASVHEDLRTRSHGVVQWLMGADKESQGKGFAYWCGMLGQDPHAVRTHLLTLYFSEYEQLTLRERYG